MSERSLICLTAFTLVTGVILLVASRALVGLIGTESLPPEIAVDSAVIEASAEQSLDLDVPKSFDEEATSNELLVASDSSVAQEDVSENQFPAEQDTEAWAIPDVTEAAPELTMEEPIEAAVDPVLEVAEQEVEAFPGQSYEPEYDYSAGYENDVTGGVPSTTYDPTANYPSTNYGNSVLGSAYGTTPEYDDSQVEPYRNEFGEYTPVETSQSVPDSSGQAAPTYAQEDRVSYVDPTTEPLDSEPDVVQTAAIADFPPAMPLAPTSPVVPHAVPGGNSTSAQTTADQNPLRLGPPLNRVAQVPRATGPAEAEIFEPERLVDPSRNNENSEDDAGDDVASLEDEETKLGEEPEETTTELQFLRRQSVLLDPGQYQFDVTLQYLVNDNDFPLAQQVGNLVQIGEAGTKQRLLLLPIEFRLGLTPVSQLFVNVPFGWSNGEFAFQGVDEFQNSGGIGDVSAGITRILIEGDDWFPDVLSTIAFSAPTGDSNFVTSLATPGNTLGEGFWTLTAGLSFIQTFDPVVVYYGFGYRHRFENNFDVNVGDGKVTVNPGKQIFYRFGAGFAVNPQVTLSASFIGSYLTEDYVEGVRLAGSIREPISVRLAATISKDKELKKGQRVRTIEPFVSFGITDDAANALFGVSCTH